MRTRHLIACGLAALALTAAGCGDDDGSGGGKEKASASSGEQTAETQPSTAPTEGKPKVEVPAGAPPKKLVVEDITEGDGKEAKAGDQVSVNYVGVSYSTKQEFDTSFGGEPFTFALGAGGVIKGWDQGVEGMKVGGRRQLVIPPDLGYGATGAPPAIKPNETLVFVVDLLSVQ